MRNCIATEVTEDTENIKTKNKMEMNCSGLQDSIRRLPKTKGAISPATTRIPSRVSSVPSVTSVAKKVCA